MAALLAFASFPPRFARILQAHDVVPRHVRIDLRNYSIDHNNSIAVHTTRPQENRIPIPPSSTAAASNTASLISSPCHAVEGIFSSSSSSCDIKVSGISHG